MLTQKELDHVVNKDVDAHEDDCKLGPPFPSLLILQQEVNGVPR